jgi:hypothetical protein
LVLSNALLFIREIEGIADAREDMPDQPEEVLEGVEAGDGTDDASIPLGLRLGLNSRQPVRCENGPYFCLGGVLQTLCR